MRYLFGTILLLVVWVMMTVISLVIIGPLLLVTLLDGEAHDMLLPISVAVKLTETVYK